MSGYDHESGGNSAPGAEPLAPPSSAIDTPALSAAVQRFKGCRWRKAAENGAPDHCAHRDVQPMAGTASFDAEAWCPDCGFYKVRRNPRKHPPIPFADDRPNY